MATFTVLGAGMMGSALCVPLCDRGHQVRLVGTHLDGEIVAALQSGRAHPTLGLRLPAAVRPMAFERFGEALEGAEVVALGVSSAGAQWAGAQLGDRALGDRPLFMITKGLHFDGDRLLPMVEVVRAAMGAAGAGVQPAAITGPCIAGELARRVPSSVVLSGRDEGATERIAELLRTDYYRLWTSTDVVGHGACAALKNAYAMGIAFGAGLHKSRGGQPGSLAMHNYESAVFAQAVVETRRIVVALGGRAESVVGLSGVGDLDVTTNGGRTGRFGALLGEGLSVAQAVERMEGATLECLEILAEMRRATRVMRAAGQLGPGDLPLLEHLAEVALDGVEVAVPFERFSAC